MIKVKRVIIKFSSVTYAFKAKEIIEQNGGKVSIRKNPNPEKGEGCGYSLTVYGNVDKYINLIKINKIKYIGIRYV